MRLGYRKWSSFEYCGWWGHAIYLGGSRYDDCDIFLCLAINSVHKMLDKG